MNAKLRALLVVAGFAVAAGGTVFTLYTPAPGVQDGDLIDAGILSDGVKKEAFCRMWQPGPDGGIVYGYKRVPGVLFNGDKAYVSSKQFIPAGWRPFKNGTVVDVTGSSTVDGGFYPYPDGGGQQVNATVYTYGPNHGAAIYDCKATPSNLLAANEDSRDEPDECACAPADDGGTATASTCEQLYADGGWGPPTLRLNFTAGNWRGNCITKECRELAGFSSWPTACGPETK